MKLLKVGRSTSCDIVLPSENVSSLHAEILILDSGEVFITDKNSANGTMVANRKLVPNQEVQVRRGDYIVLADSELPWSRVPQPDSYSGFKTIVNIGSNYRNDIQLTSEYASRFHAILKISNNGRKAFIRDLDSKNGVKVNGLKIKANKDIPVKNGDNIICADQDITEDLKQYIPSAISPAIKWTGIAAAFIILLGLIGWLGKNVLSSECKYCGADPKCEKIASPADLRTGVVLIQTRYYYEVELENNPLPNDKWDGIVKFDSENLLKIVSGTGFFVDSKGTIATNRHVACPWEYADSDEIKAIRTAFNIWLNEALAYKSVINDNVDYYAFRNSELGSIIDANTRTAAELNSVLSQIRNSNIKIKGHVYARYVAYPGRNYTHLDEMERCDFIADSGTKDKDVALLQLNDPSTPSSCYVYDIHRTRTDKPTPLTDQLYIIGYPLGMILGLDNTTKKLEPGLQSTRCSKVPSHFTFELQGMAVGGQSGSPVFDEYGHLVGMISESFNAGGIINSVQAVYIKELYDSEVDFDNNSK